MKHTTRILLPLLLAAAPLGAQDDDRQASELFYRAFWLEQAAGDAEQAEALYARVADGFPDAPEAPRAILGLVRIRSARGEDVAELVARLDGEAAERARALAGAGRQPFGYLEWSKSEDRLKEVLAEVYLAMSDPHLEESERRFAIEAGAAAHPMLRAAILSLDYEHVWHAAGILLDQGHPDARGILLDALRADGHPFRYAVLHAIGGRRVDDRALIEAVAELSRTGSPQLRRDAWHALLGQVDAGSDAAGVAWPPLARALEEGDPDVREQVLELDPRTLAGAPAEFVDVLLARMAADVRGVWRNADDALPLLAGDARHAAAVEALVAARGPSLPVHEARIADAAWPVLARATLAHLERFPEKAKLMGPASMLRAACARSRDARVATVAAAFERGELDLLLLAKRGDPPRLDLGAERAALLERALEIAFGGGEHGAFARRALSELEIGADDAPAVAAVLRARPDAPLGTEHLAALDGALFVPEVYRLLLERLSPEWMMPMLEAARLRPALAELFAERVLDLRGEEWRWDEAASQAPGPVILISANYAIRVALARPPLRARLVEHVDDDRAPIADLAVRVAVEDGNQLALAAALDSPFPRVQEEALKYLEDPATVAAYLANREDPAAARAALVRLREIGNGQQAGVAEQWVTAGGEHLTEAWRTWLALSPEPAVTRALGEVAGAGRERRRAALSILTRTDDPRRVPVFRGVLRGELPGDVLSVVRTVGEQYLIELGPEVVEQLRSPDDGVRNAATRTIDRLKFYAEAKNLFPGNR